MLCRHLHYLDELIVMCILILCRCSHIEFNYFEIGIVERSTLRHRRFQSLTFYPECKQWHLAGIMKAVIEVLLQLFNPKSLRRDLGSCRQSLRPSNLLIPCFFIFQWAWLPSGLKFHAPSFDLCHGPWHDNAVQLNHGPWHDVSACEIALCKWRNAWPAERIAKEERICDY